MSDFFLYERYEKYESEESVFYICSLDENCDCDDCVVKETENPEVEEPVFLKKLEKFVVNTFNSIFDNEDYEDYFYEFNP